MPAHGPLLVDALGNLWAADFRPWLESEYRWRVLDMDGRYLGAVLLPALLRVEQIGEDFVLGISEDELGVEYVEVYALDKREGN